MLTFPGDGVAFWTQMNEWISKEMCKEFAGEDLPKSTGLRQGSTVHYSQPCREVEASYGNKATRLARITLRRSTREHPRTITLSDWAAIVQF